MSNLLKLKEKFKTMSARTGKPLSAITINNYCNKLNRLCQEVTGKSWDSDDISWLLKDPEKVIAVLRESKLGAKKDYLSPISKLLHHSNVPAETLDKYRVAMKEFKDAEYSVRNQNLASADSVERAIPVSEANERIDTYVPESPTDLLYKMICSFYFQNNLIPRNDMPLFRLINSKRKPNNDEYNYIVMNGRNPVSIVMNNYKTRAKYGRQKFNITPKLSKVLTQYISDFNKKPGDFLVGETDSPVPKTTFVDTIGKATKAVLGTRLNVNLIREMLQTDYKSKGLHSIADEQEFARRMLHSVAVGNEYTKLNLPKSDSEED